MTLSELIAELTKALKNHGDLEVFDANYFSVNQLYVEKAEDQEWGDQFPDDWNMPEKFLRIGEEK